MGVCDHFFVRSTFFLGSYRLRKLSLVSSKTRANRQLTIYPLSSPRNGVAQDFVAHCFDFVVQKVQLNYILPDFKMFNFNWKYHPSDNRNISSRWHYGCFLDSSHYKQCRSLLSTGHKLLHHQLNATNIAILYVLANLIPEKMC